MNLKNCSERKGLVQSRARLALPLAALFLVSFSSPGLDPRPLDSRQTQASEAAQDGNDFPDETILNERLGKVALRIAGENVLHYYWWRHDVPMSWQDRPVEVFEGKSLRFSVRKDGDECLGSGRWLVFSDEVIPVATALAGGGLRVTSVIPRFPGSTPQGFELRFLGRGTESELAGPVAEAHARVDAARKLSALPPASLPTSASYGQSDVTVAPLEDLFDSKAEVKNGVALFRFPGPDQIAGVPAGARMGFGVFVAFAGTDSEGRVRVDWTLRPSEVAPLLDSLGRQGFMMESLTAAAPGLDDETTRTTLVARGQIMDLAKAVSRELGAMVPAPTAVDTAFHAPNTPESLGLDAGRLADGWHAGATLPAGPNRAVWTVHEDPKVGSIASMQDPGSWDHKTFNLLLNDKVQFQDGSITLRMRADHGRIDQGGGPIWRVQDENNYYVCRFNPLEQDFRIYHVIDGVRVQIQAYGSLPFQSGDWFTIRVDQHGDEITCTLNDSIVLRVRDDHFLQPGGVGIWSKADSQPSVAGLWVENVTNGDR